MDAFADLAALGLTAGQIAAKTKTRRHDVADGLRAARVPEVREVVTEVGLTLEQGSAGGVLRPARDYALLLDRVTNPRSWGPGFEHTVQRLRDEGAESAPCGQAVTERMWLLMPPGQSATSIKAGCRSLPLENDAGHR